MQLDPNFNEFVELLLANDVRFMVVGSYAVAAHGHPRYTGDLDIWILTSAENAERLLSALDVFGFGGVGLTPADFTQRDQVVQLGHPPLRIDLLTSLDGVRFEECYERRVDVDLGGLTIPFIGLHDLKHNKEASGRPQDLADLDALAVGGENEA